MKILDFNRNVIISWKSFIEENELQWIFEKDFLF